MKGEREVVAGVVVAPLVVLLLSRFNSVPALPVCRRFLVAERPFRSNLQHGPSNLLPFFSAALWLVDRAMCASFSLLQN